MVYAIKEGFQVDIDHPAVAGGNVGLHGQDSLLGAAFGAVAVTRFGEARIEDRRQHLQQRLAEIIDRLNDIFGSEVGDDDQLHYAQGIANRLERDNSLMAQLDQHDEAQLMHGMFPKKVTDAVLDALSDHEKLSMPLLEDEDTGRQFALLIPKLLGGRSGRDSQTGK